MATTAEKAREVAVLRALVEGTAEETGRQFFYSLVENLAEALGTDAAWVTEYLEPEQRLRALAFRLDGRWIEGYEHHIENTPCEAVVRTRDFVHYPDQVLELFPDDPDIQSTGIMSYMGMPLLDTDGRVLGHLAVMDRRPLPPDPTMLATYRIFAARAGAELRRLHAEKQLRDREEQLEALLDSAMDAVLQMDAQGRLVLANAAAREIFVCSGDELSGKPATELLAPDSRAVLESALASLQREAGEHRWLPALRGRRCTGEEFAAEATLSHFTLQQRNYFSLILRDVEERLQAEHRIQSLTREMDYLRDELRNMRNFDDIVGQSEPLLQTLKAVQQVAPTDASVLIQGETGTGKELVARAVHAGSARAEGPFIKVNCAAMPGSLIESELFGHERGAFTGATARREGRFALAHGGSIFLDEVGELPLDVQAKLLRVLQEGEFEAVGATRTRKVDVRVIAATNRDLQAMVDSGEFRADLYYRLHVFPVNVPPLRERGDDVVLLASDFAERFGRRLGRSLRPFSPASLQRLRAYHWPGNVRELRNVIERAVILAEDGELDIAAVLPAVNDTAVPENGGAGRVLTQAELQALERDNLQRALDQCGGKVSGSDGAARLLGVNPSTLSSRLRALGLK